MNKNIPKSKALLITMIILASMSVSGQSIVDRLNSLPPTQKERAPDFDIEKKYYFNFDSLNLRLVIEEVHQRPSDKKRHFYSFLYEIPLADLSAGSFSVANKDGGVNELKLKLGTVKGKVSIAEYWLQYEDIVLVSESGNLSLGPWDYSDNLENELLAIIKIIASNTPNKSYETNLHVKPVDKGGWRYKSEAVTMLGDRVTQKELNGGYYFNHSIENPAYYSKTKNPAQSISMLSSDIGKELRRNNIKITQQTPVIITVDKQGNMESIFIVGLTNDQNKLIDIGRFLPFTPGDDGSGSKNKRNNSNQIDQNLAHDNIS